MSRGLPGAIAVLLLAPALACSRAVPNPASSETRPDLGGVWQATGSADISVYLLPGEEISFTPYGAQRYRTVDHMKDPSNQCHPVGFFRGMQTSFAPFQIVQGPDALMIGMEFVSDFRLIYVDGEKHPDDVSDYPGWMGHSIGTWEGDTLVVDTIGFNDGTWLDTPGLEHSEKLHSIERFQRIDPDTLKWTVTIEDPVFFTKPFTYAREFKREHSRLMSYSCTENEKDFAHMQSEIGGAHNNKNAMKFPSDPAGAGGKPR